ncbi:hypothetical protein TPHA_0A00260 [Tetrapisispora phaffii CBS 4417]|uniref:Peroxisomal biogenesis factor 11 n=1 Tax=Tetrapisispora phaffii (strain ATCC 24235 / CBS 4417 / NBRC 1672 / NRRL Y-8282 / UCD 70-5) TaxID=1071381 RepID=G8BMI3_TETPH|nr:hypothetical protein TPHA_0A00260 [Tetrapisispora phaffii CBS 4417]CCE61111.1 hypothetical protein TPHA_0A00260 [Tetrapisispora phaffii CBS 4417]
MVCDTLVHHPSLNKLVTFLETVNGREKSLRLLQYLFSFILSNKNLNLILNIKKNVLLYKNLQAQIGIVRKFLRFLKPISILQSLIKLYNKRNGSLHIDFILTFYKNLFNCLYLTFDQLNLLRILNVLPKNEFTVKRLPKITNYFWLFGLVTSLLTSAKTIITLNEKLIELKNNNIEKQNEFEDEKIIQSLNIQKHQVLRKIVWDLLDSTVVVNSLDLIKLNQNGYASLAGVITSYFGIKEAWDKIPPSTK